MRHGELGDLAADNLRSRPTATSVLHAVLRHQLNAERLSVNEESMSMTIFGRFNVRVVVAGAGLCGVAMALGPQVAAAPLLTGGYDCMSTSAGEVGAAPAAAACAPAAAPVADMAGIPMALPGPVPVVPAAPPVPVVPLAPPVPVVPVAAPVPLGAPLAPVAGGAPLTDMAGAFGGKGDPTSPPAAGAPVSGQPILPGPGA